MERLADFHARLKRDETVRHFLKFVQMLAKGNVAALDASALRDLPPRIANVVKAAVTGGTVGGGTWGDSTAWQELTSEWMTLLSSRTLFGRIPFRKAAFNTRTLVEETPGTAAWVNEGGGIPLCQLSLDTVQLPPAKIGGMDAFPKETMEVANPASLDAIDRAMQNTIHRFSDQALVNPDIGGQRQGRG